MKRRSECFPKILWVAIAVAGLTSCSSEPRSRPPESLGASFRPQLLYAPPQTSETCTCTGTGPGGAPVTVDCGQSACGSDYTTYACSASGWSSTGVACTGGCQCTGTGPGGAPVTVDCGQSACGSDYITYSCSASGWSWTGASCTAGTGGVSGTGGSTVPPTCTGTGPGGVPVTVNVGESACGSDYMTYACSASGWSWTGVSCAPGTGGVSGTGGSTALPDGCTGTGPGGVPVTVNLGESACGSDYVIYACSASGWSWTGESCAPGTGGSGTGGSGTGGSGTGGSGTGGTTGCIGNAWPTANPAATGPFAVEADKNVGPLAGYTPDPIYGDQQQRFNIYRPTNLATSGYCHPILIWANAHTDNPEPNPPLCVVDAANNKWCGQYLPLMNHLASHGFVVMASLSTTTSRGDPLPTIAGLNWLLQRAEDPVSPYYHRLDTANIGQLGHSEGGLSTCMSASEPRYKALAAISGARTLTGVHTPLLFFCGGKDTVMPCSSVRNVFLTVTTQPAFLIDELNADHGSWIYQGPSGVSFTMAAAWFRAHLMGDTANRQYFYGPSCTFCTDSRVQVEQNSLMNP